ncbi:hypothetical protein TNCV_3009541 [Trichonephila clavipes]|nr:hypothetical protein TNCV_3009541 [Trichonephila clavipes]
MEFYSTKGPTYGRSLGGGHKVSEISPQASTGRSRLTYEEFETVIISSPLVINISDNRLSLAENNKGNSGSLENGVPIMNTLQQRGKWMIEKDNVMCGTMVIVKEDFTPVCNWLLGHVVEVYHDGDRFNSCRVIYSQFGLAIHQNDHQARRRFVEWAQNEIAVAPDFHKRILFSDEAHFWLNGYVNKQNCRIWSEANPQVYVETPLHPEKLTVWCALWAGGILLQKR